MLYKIKDRIYNPRSQKWETDPKSISEYGYIELDSIEELKRVILNYSYPMPDFLFTKDEKIAKVRESLKDIPSQFRTKFGYQIRLDTDLSFDYDLIKSKFHKVEVPTDKGRVEVTKEEFLELRDEISINKYLIQTDISKYEELITSGSIPIVRLELRNFS